MKPTPTIKKNQQEQRILAAVDSLAQLILDLYHIQPDQDFKETLKGEPKLVKAFQALSPLLLPMINQRIELLPQIISQLFLQKMPYDPRPDFSSFYINAVHSLIATLPQDSYTNTRSLNENNVVEDPVEDPVEESIMEYDTATLSEDVEEVKTEEVKTEEAEDLNDAAYDITKENNLLTLQRILAWAFPKEPVLSPWTKRGYYFDAYLPGLNLIIRLGKPNHSVPNSLWLKKENLHLLWIDNELLNQPFQLRKACLQVNS